jgi:hypothetical protein
LSAAVRSDAAEHSDAAGARRITTAGQVRIGIGSSWLLAKERCCESGLESGAISGCAGADRRPQGTQMEHGSTNVQEGKTGV